jgi:predicted methyltransferase
MKSRVLIRVLAAALASIGCGLLAAASSGADATDSTDATDAETASAIAKASVGSHRSAQNIARNDYRHPVETLSFFGLRSDMTVIEALPGGALWYAEILAPVLRENGQYIAADYDPMLPDQPDYRLEGHKKIVDRIAGEPDVFGPAKIVKLTAPTSIDLGEPGSADMVLTFRSNHGWIRDDAIDEVYAAFFEVLRPGGVLGVVQHRAGDLTDTSTFNGYVKQDRVIELASAAGFVLEETSEINANPKDTANYPGGVWTLPPSLRLGGEDKATYLAIGESDRMTLRFRKPQ